MSEEKIDDLQRQLKRATAALDHAVAVREWMKREVAQNRRYVANLRRRVIRLIDLNERNESKVKHAAEGGNPPSE